MMAMTRHIGIVGVSAEGAVTVIPSESGVRIDQAKLRALFLDELLRPAAGPTRVVEAPAAVDTSAFTTEQAKELAPKLSLASTFTTYYPPSGSRHANISTTAAFYVFPSDAKMKTGLKRLTETVRKKYGIKA